MNADKLIEAAKREGNNSAIDKFRRSLKSSSITTKSRKQATSSDDDPIWFSAATTAYIIIINYINKKIKLLVFYG